MSAPGNTTPLSQQILQARKAKAWSQEDLAEHSGISLRTIQRLERGESNPRPYTLRQLRQVLELTEPVPATEASAHSLAETDRVRLHQFNLLCSVSILLPGIHLLVLWLYWRIRRDQPTFVYWSRKLFSLQILWVVGIVVALLLTPVITGFIGQVSIGKVSIIALVYLSMLFLNVALLIRNGFRIEQNRLQYLQKIPYLI
ncbi:MAG: helix-turn-helix transcriptional regulator [Bacteroidota bacterium]